MLRATRIVAMVAAAVLSATVAEGAVLRGTVTGGALPAASAGQTDIRAVNLQTSVVAAATEVPRSGRWSLTVPPGPYALLTGVVTRTGQRQAISPVVRVRRGAPARVAVSLRRTKAPRRAQKARHHATLAGPVIAVRNLSASGPRPELGRGFSDMFITDFTDDANPCRPTVVEWEKRGEIQKEIDLGNTLLPPGQRIQKRWIQPQVFVEGSLTTTADGISAWDVRLRDATTGDIVGGDNGTLPPGGDPFEAAGQITKRLSEQLCGGTYTVAFTLTTDNLQAVFDARGTITAIVTATGTGRAKGIPPTRFTGSAAISYGNLAFTAKIPDCAFAGATSDQGTLTVTLEVTPAGRLKVTWDPSPRTLAARSTIACRQGSLPALGPGIAGAAPTSFELPVSGGSQALSGDPALTSGGFGIFHAGTVIVTRNSP